MPRGKLKVKKLYQSRYVAPLSIAVGIIVAAAVGTMGLTAGDWTVKAVFLAVALFWMGFSFLRCAGAGVRPDNWGVTIVNPLRTIRVPWSQIQDFVLDRHGFSC